MRKTCGKLVYTYRKSCGRILNLPTLFVLVGLLVGKPYGFFTRNAHIARHSFHTTYGLFISVICKLSTLCTDPIISTAKYI
jgi:hypothetical protein